MSQKQTHRQNNEEAWKKQILDEKISNFSIFTQKLARFKERDDAQAPSKMEYLRDKKTTSNDKKKEYFGAKADAFTAQV